MIFKKRIAEDLELKVIKLMYKYKKDLENNRMAGGLLNRSLDLIGITFLSTIGAVGIAGSVYLIGAVALIDPTLSATSTVLIKGSGILAPALGLAGIAAVFNHYKRNMEINNKVYLKNEFEYKMNSLLKGVDEEHPAVKRFLINKISIDKVGEKIIKMAKENKMPTVKKNNKLKP